MRVWIKWLQLPITISACHYVYGGDEFSAWANDEANGMIGFENVSDMMEKLEMKSFTIDQVKKLGQRAIDKLTRPYRSGLEEEGPIRAIQTYWEDWCDERHEE